MSRLWIGLSFVVGASCGIAFAELRRTAAPPQPVGAPAHRTVPNRPEPPRTEPAPGSCGAEVERLQTEILELRAALALHGGTPEPPGVPAAATEAALTAWLATAADDLELPASLRAVDCAEYPCIALFAYDEGVPADSSIVQPVRGRYLEEAGGDGGALVHVVGSEAGAFAAVAFQGRDDPPATPGTRTALRIADLVDGNTP